jgi:sulfite reductase (NADPH) flavoprotein alpha-component
LWPALAEQGSQPVRTAPVIQGPATVERAEALHDRNNPFPAPLLANRQLNGEGSGKDTRHLAFSLARSSLAYEAGDALGVVPTNCPELVAEVLRILGAHGDETVPGPQGDTSLRKALSAHCEITRISDLLLKAIAERTRDPGLVKLTAPGVNGELTQYLRGRDVIDLLAAFPSVRFEPAEFVKLLRKLQPRLYSISSSPKACASEVHLTVAVVRYTSFDRLRKGLCSAFLADRVPAGTPVPVFLHKNKHFRPPADPARPMIMVGPGTGIAPFRAFLQERREIGAPGRNWLFFGDQRQSCDFLYRDELEVMVRDRTLSRLDLAFSRDQSQKVYVQHRMLEHARELYAWLEEGGHFYVCGDAARMAKDVDAALHKAIEIAGQKSPDQAQEYVRALAAAKRYQRDVY